MVVIYSTPKNPTAFDEHYFNVHVPMGHGVQCRGQKQQTSKVPGYAEATHKFGEVRRLSKVRHPSRSQIEKVVWPDGRVPSEALFLTPVLS